MDTKLNILRRNSFIPILFLLLLCSTVDALAQFNPKKQAVSLKKITDTVILTKPKTVLKFELYSDAYDAYRRKLQMEQRNSFTIIPGLDINQGSFTNWQKGGDNYFNVMGRLNFAYNYTAPVFSLSTTFIANYGLQYSSERMSKTVDNFNFTTTPSWNISKSWKLSGKLIWKSQFTKGYSYPKDKDKIWVSSFMAPGTADVSIGITYAPVIKREGTKFTLFLSPLAGGMTFVLNDSLSVKGGLGINPKLDRNPKFKMTFGASMDMNFSTSFAKKKITYTTNFNAYWDYEIAPRGAWTNTFAFKFTDTFSARIFAHLIYDDQIATELALNKRKDGLVPSAGDFLQINQTVGLGMTFNIASKKHKPIKESTITRSRNKYNK